MFFPLRSMEGTADSGGPRDVCLELCRVSPWLGGRPLAGLLFSRRAAGMGFAVGSLFSNLCLRDEKRINFGQMHVSCN